VSKEKKEFSLKSFLLYVATTYIIQFMGRITQYLKTVSLVILKTVSLVILRTYSLVIQKTDSLVILKTVSLVILKTYSLVIQKTDSLVILKTVSLFTHSLSLSLSTLYLSSHKLDDVL